MRKATENVEGSPVVMGLSDERASAVMEPSGDAGEVSTEKPSTPSGDFVSRDAEHLWRAIKYLEQRPPLPEPPSTDSGIEAMRQSATPLLEGDPLRLPPKDSA